jgi:hypothetical protein
MKEFILLATVAGLPDPATKPAANSFVALQI